MHRKSSRLALALCASTLTAGGVALLSGPAFAATSGWEDCAEVVESSYSASEIALPLQLSEVSTVSTPVISQPVISQPVLAQRVIAQPVIAQPVLAEPMNVSVSFQPEFSSPRYFQSERFVSEPISFQYRSARFSSELLPSRFVRGEQSPLGAQEQVEAEASEAKSRIQHHANVAKARINREVRKSERRIASETQRSESSRMAETSWLSDCC
ncbi:hypothetical protein [Sphaerimonospora thailandensis]|uniref:Uncharacterized protein n=1 Tax=Sphaerimonospora thailandensis TaxID=795644 RepID=A0A8J3RAZ3_9ACTN|nr:hypothetical protein [Sphaerimonospora thailandensis]GIH69238.1 hypothetical protein Mth01_14910 [Sphaerimonospora thailandensis]